MEVSAHVECVTTPRQNAFLCETTMPPATIVELASMLAKYARTLSVRLTACGWARTERYETEKYLALYKVKHRHAKTELHDVLDFVFG
ncbi:hypothetical protein EVAR_85613_1 [Eumeta japonica]|uniref:Uncharacterized protein n=1 Tax=Eumeta variegata TaxID=151549 RepID=A0A4C1XT60_EUMVA|nr:hypothetical protein EVAR_85613_1 [Eumeta japonica]